MNNFKYYVYQYIRKSDDTPYYIGKGTGNRALQKTNRSVSVPKDKSKIKYIIRNIKENDAINLEISYIKLFGRKDIGTGILLNKTDGGEGISGCVKKGNKIPKTKETKLKISMALRGISKSVEHKQKISDALKGKPKSAKAKIAIINGLLGRKHSDETKQKISKSLIGNQRARKTKNINTKEL